MKEIEVGQTRRTEKRFHGSPGYPTTVKFNGKYYSLDCPITITAVEEYVMMRYDNGMYAPEWVVQSYDMDTLVEEHPKPKGPGPLKRLWARLFSRRRLPEARLLKAKGS